MVFGGGVCNSADVVFWGKVYVNGYGGSMERRRWLGCSIALIHFLLPGGGHRCRWYPSMPVAPVIEVIYCNSGKVLGKHFKLKIVAQYKIKKYVLK
ncbi:hypothetical protein Hanom_Chr03g00178471 [Helianthus anomalus]